MKSAPHRTWLSSMLFLPFFASITGAWAWFYTDIGRSRPSTLDSRPGIWLQARTNIPGYTFVPEIVSADVMKTLGTTNILSGTFLLNQKADLDQKSEVSNQNLNVESSTLTVERSPSLPSTHGRSRPSPFVVRSWNWTANRPRSIDAPSTVRATHRRPCPNESIWLDI